MDYCGKFYQTEEEFLTKLSIDPKYSVITGVEFNPELREITYTIRTSNPILDVTGDISKGQVKRIRVEN